MKKFILAALVLLASFAGAQTHTVANKDTANVFTNNDQFTKGVFVGPVTFANLSTVPSQADGNIIYCSDCIVQDPCAGSGSGAFAQRVGGIWACATHGGGGGGGGNVNPGTLNVLGKYVAGSVIGNSSISDNGAAVVTSETFSASQLISTVAIGTAPLSVTSTTVVPNLNVSQLLGQTWAIPGTIGGTTPGDATFVNLTISGTCTGCNTGAVLLAGGTQTILGTSLLTNQGTEQIGPAISTLDSYLQDSSLIGGGSNTLAIQKDTSGTLQIGVQSLAQGLSAFAFYGVASYDATTNVAGVPTGGDFVAHVSSTVTYSHGPVGSFSIAEAQPAVGTTMAYADGSNNEADNIGAGTVTVLETYNAATNGNSGGGSVTSSYGFNSQIQNAGSVNAAYHSVDQGAAANNYGILLDGVTHNDLGAGITKVGNLTISQIGGGTQCLQINSAGVVSGTGSVCGAGGGGGAVSSVFGRTGAVTAVLGDYSSFFVQLAPTATQKIQPSTSAAIPLQTECPVSAAGTLACLQVLDNLGGNILSVLQNDTIQVGTGVGGSITLTNVFGPNANPATAGVVAVSSTDNAVCWRNNLNTGNLCFDKTSADIVRLATNLAIKETVAGSGIAGYGVLYEDSSTHVPAWSLNNGSFLNIALETGAMTSGHLISVNATTNLIADSGVAATSVATSTPTNHAVAVGSATQALTFVGPGSAGQCLISAGAGADPAYGACGGGGGAALSGITAAAGANSINSGDNAQVWNWQGTTSGRIAFKISENSASTSAGTPVLFQVSALATSTMNPVQFDFNGNGIRMNTSGQIAAIGTGGILPTALSSVTGSGAAVLATSPTNVTLDAEGSGNAITRPFYVEYEGGCNNTVASPGAFDLPTATAATFTCFGTTTTFGAIDFVDASTTVATGHFTLPQGWTGNMDARIIWFANASSANAVRWSIQTGCIADTEAFNGGPSYNAASQTNTAYTGTANQRKTTTLSAIAMTNCSAGETMYFQLSRIGADAGDTLAATAELNSLQFEGRTTK